MDDFAHHPTAVCATLKALRQRYFDRRIRVFFEPRSATSRRKIFQKQYAESFEGADEIWIAEPYLTQETDSEDRFSSESLTKALASKGFSAHTFSNVDSSLENWVKSTRSGDLWVVLSNGGFDGLVTKLCEALGERQGAS